MFEATSAPAPDSEPVCEPSAFQALVREIGQDSACEVRAVFWNDTSARLGLFRELGLEQHRARIAREAHSLKSTARTFGYLRLAAVAQRLEKAAAVLGDADYLDLVRRMDAAYAAALEQEPRS